LRVAHRDGSLTVGEIDETGYPPLRASAGRAPAPGFHLAERRDVDGLIAYRFVSESPRTISVAGLRRRVITLERPHVLALPGAGRPTPTRMPSVRKKI
jgi:hypothetical protein